MASKANVVLLREPTPSSDSDQDRYEAAFAAAKYAPFSIPVLETVLTNIAELASATEQSDFDGVIVTSARSCETWDKANGAEKDDKISLLCCRKGYCLDATFQHAQRRHPWRIFGNRRAARQLHSGFTALRDCLRAIAPFELIEDDSSVEPKMPPFHSSRSTIGRPEVSIKMTEVARFLNFENLRRKFGRMLV
ncbi:hypothetical protein ARMGADRAFT_1092135 [Armillaria gallica]|uniref:Hydroxymethylbilane hydrolyase [cyclizing] n=1 Tax=Armillaria gallica TaxID=47427 RepID=A0A2H3CFE2_ARMGA|nr:hypothetical protein ARMGADRAFT_1092135 [Armillaria gallica]